MAEAHDATEDAPVAGPRFYIGVALFAISLIGPLVAIPLMGILGLSAGTIASSSAGILVGAEVLLVAAAAIMGKSGYTYIKSKIFGTLKRYGPPREVGPTRYRIGLVLFVLPLILGFVSPYAKGLIPYFEGNELWFALGGDLILLIGLFVLGGAFWDKLRALFVHGARAVFPEPSS
ncbi:MAG: transporter suffix domain-containing protein [Methyloceanibacter sp.]|nr:transporter suffix domain-containing protein [Methyloceanibacter sp.]